jgi:hypothetical protein
MQKKYYERIITSTSLAVDLGSNSGYLSYEYLWVDFQRSGVTPMNSEAKQKKVSSELLLNINQISCTYNSKYPRFFTCVRLETIACILFE